MIIAWVLSIPWYEVDVGLENIFYAMEALVTAVLVTNIYQYAFWKTKTAKHAPLLITTIVESIKENPDGSKYKECAVNKKRNWWPSRIILLASPLMLAYPIAVVIIYSGGYYKEDPKLKMWKDGSWIPNTEHGVILWIARYIGFILLTIGIVQVIGLHTKIAKRWREIRNGDVKKSGAKSTSKKDGVNAAAKDSTVVVVKGATPAENEANSKSTKQTTPPASNGNATNPDLTLLDDPLLRPDGSENSAAPSGGSKKEEPIIDPDDSRPFSGDSAQQRNKIIALVEKQNEANKQNDVAIEDCGV